MKIIDNFIQIETKVLIKREDDEADQLAELGIEGVDTTSWEEKDVLYMFDATEPITEIREAYIPYKDDFKKVVLITFSKDFIQTPPLLVDIEDLLKILKEFKEKQ